jgi:hypothetical protein
VQLEGGHNLRWNSDKIMRRAAINDKRIYHLSLVNGHLSFGRCKPLACAVLIEALKIRASLRFSVTRLVTSASGAIWSPKMTIDN